MSTLTIEPLLYNLVILGVYSQSEILSLFLKQAHPEFLGGAKVAYCESHAPELLSGKEVILLSVCSVSFPFANSQINSQFVRPRHPDSKIRSHGVHHDKHKTGKVLGKGDSEGWMEVSKRSSSSTHEPRHSEFKQDLVVPVSGVVADLFDPSESFFRDEEPAKPSPVHSEGSRLAKLLELAKGSTDSTTPVSAGGAGTDLSLSAPSFTPLSQAGRKPASPRAAVVSSPPPPVAADELSLLQWIYLDPDGQKQGPFSSSQMATWFSAGYFPKSLPVTWFSSGEPANSAYHALDKCYINTAPFAALPISPQGPQGNIKGEHSREANKRAAQHPPPTVAPPPAPSITHMGSSAGTAPDEKRGWLWSLEDDAKLERERDKKAMSLAEIMKLEESKKKSKGSR